ncbi:UNVERIFIED_CONTAM: ribosomal protein S18 acetylase RimI-like enzyme [Brevibacillus sp. OAP136]
MLITKQGLSEQELAAIAELADICNRADGIQLKLNWETLESRPTDVTNDFLFYDGDKLVGFAALYVFRSTEAELSGMVHPDYRRQGIFTQLTRAAQDECRRRNIPKLIYIVYHLSESGKAFATATGAAYGFSEYWMARTKDLLPPVNPDPAKAVTLRLVEERDLEDIIALNVSGFSMSEEDSREYVSQSQASERDKTYISHLGETPVGKIGVMEETDKAFIFGFCVASDMQRKGLGRQILSKTIQLLKEKGFQQIELEVAVENLQALGLYESCGFETTGANDYFELALS